MNKRNLAVILTIVILGGVLFFVARQAASKRGAGALTQYKVAKVERGQVKKTVSATGTLKPWTVVDIKSRAGGQVMQVNVEAGDEVKRGQIIARIDPTDNLLNVGTARADLDSAQARRSQTQEQYKLQLAQGQIAIRTAEANLRNSKASRSAALARLTTARQASGAQPEITRTSIASAQAAYQQAVKQRQQLTSTTKQQKAAAQAAYDQAIANRDNAKINLERQQSLVTKGFVAKQAVDTAQANFSVAASQVSSAQAKLDTVDAELFASIETADARVQQSLAALQQARTGRVDIQSRQNAVREAEAALRQADAQIAQQEANVANARAALKNNEIRRLDVDTASATITRSQAQMKNAETVLEQTTVRAPSGGIVLQKYVEPGTIITSGMSLNAAGTSIIQLGDVSKMYVDVTVDETDIASIDVGQPVEVTIEAYPGLPFEGKVSRINPQAIVEQNVTSIHVRVEVDNSSASFRLLKPEMNATCEFVVDDKEDVIAVPSEAVHEDDNGKYVDIVVTPGKPAPADPKSKTPPDPDALVDVKTKKVAVEIGVEGNETTEIVSGLKGDETIVTQTIEAAPQAATSPFGGGGIGGGRGGGGGGRR